MEEIELTINPTIKYSFPEKLAIRKLANKRILVIDTETPNWITLQSNVEYLFFDSLLNGKTVNEIIIEYKLLNNKNGINELKNVLIEIHNNDFCKRKLIHSNKDNCNLTLYVTDKCNLQCIHCYRYKHNSKIELKTEQWKNVILQFSRLKKRGEFVTFTGGEISLRNDLIEIISYSFSLGLKNIILTNGIIWQEEDYRQIVRYSHEIQISLDGIYESQNDRIRGSGTFKKVINSLKIITKLANKINPKLRIALAMTFMAEDLQQVRTGIRDFKNEIEMLLDREIIFRISTRLKPGRTIKKLNLNQQNHYRIATTYIKNLIYNDNYWESKLMNVACFSPFVRIINCGFGQNIGVLSNGDVMACSESSLELVGNVKENSLWRIRTLLTNIFQSTSIENMETCRDCDLKYICGGGCRLDNLYYSCSYLNSSICIQDESFKNFIYNIMADRREWSWNY